MKELTNADLDYYSKKISILLSASMAMSGAARSIGFILGTLLAVQFAGGNTNWAGVPGVLFLGFGAVATLFFGRLIKWLGYRKLLIVSCVLGFLSSFIGLAAVIENSLVLLILCFTVNGVAQGFIVMTRYGAAESTFESKKARAMGVVIFGATFGSILGPAVVDFGGKISQSLNYGLMTGPWVLQALLFLLLMFVMARWLKPEPAELAAAIKNLEENNDFKSVIKIPSDSIWTNKLIGAGGLLLFSQVSMVLVMAITPVYLKSLSYGMDWISWTISAHMLGMFGLSFPIGWLIDKMGTIKMSFIGALLMGIACLICINFFIWSYIFGLFLLGVGWNVCFIAGSRMLTQSIPAQKVQRVQGINESLMQASSGLTILSSGFLFTYLGFVTMCWLGVFTSFIIFTSVIIYIKK